jgi:hypothetical protein
MSQLDLHLASHLLDDHVILNEVDLHQVIGKDAASVDDLLCVALSLAEVDLVVPLDVHHAAVGAIALRISEIEMKASQLGRILI